MSDRSSEVVRRAIAVYNERDFEALAALNDPNVEVDWSASRGPMAGVYHGREEAIGFFRDFVGTFEEVRLEVERVIEAGDAVIVPNSTRVRGRDGIETVARSALIFDVRGGRIARIRLYQETAEALAAAGLGGPEA
jgi:ketosteroid isomerase-like protein